MDKSSKHVTIAIDGPAGSGKSTVGEALAREIDYLFFDTGLLYRAVTATALAQQVPPADETAVAELCRRLVIEVLAPAVDDGRQCTVVVDSEDVTTLLRTPAVDKHVSQVAANAEVRAVLTAQMRTIGQQGGVVMVGRDIGTVVMPDAPVKIYLDAAVEERARRRFEEVAGRDDEDRSFDAILENLRARDATDSQRDSAPLRIADDAHIVDTTQLGIDEVVARLKLLLS